MHERSNVRMIGIFWCIGILLLLSVIAYGLKDSFDGEEERTVVMYFEESINGLNVGSDVVLKGVKVGEVKRINIQINSETLNFSIPVYAVIKKRVIRTINNNNGGDINDLIKKGLRARLTTQSYVTGQLMIELEMLPDTPIKYHNNPRGVFEIPTALSAFGELSRNLQSLPIAEGIKNFSDFFAELNSAMPKFKAIVNDLAAVMNKNRKSTLQLPENANSMMINVEAAAKSLKNLTDYLERHPEALLKGKK